MSAAPPDPNDNQTPPPSVVHIYDGIVEEDNRLPNWWLGLLYGAIVFSFAYWFVYESAHARPGPWQTYAAESAAAAQRAAAAPLSDQALSVMAADRQVTQTAGRLFVQVCSPCHAAGGQGLVGPNLTDRFWLHGGSPTAIHKSVTEGFPTKGMPPWGKILGDARVRSLAAYVTSLKGKNLPGKPPQGIEDR